MKIGNGLDIMLTCTENASVFLAYRLERASEPNGSRVARAGAMIIIARAVPYRVF